MLWTAESTGAPAPFTTANVLADYLAMNPGDTAYTDGTDMQAAAAYRQKIGLIDASGKRHQIGPYVALNAGDVAQISTAAFLMGAVGLGVQLPTSAIDQFARAEPFSVVTGGGIEGGHYMPLVGRNSVGNFLVWTWGRLHAAEPGWLTTWMDEGIAYLSLERLRNSVSPQGFDEATLLRDLTALQSA
jgi:hypothetical protein